jgi:poly[(R)-3-hydroxyalkanoate] polymerase subunit PhaE
MKADEQKTGAEPLSLPWFRAAADFWEIMAKMAQGEPLPGKASPSQEGARPSIPEWGQSALEKWPFLSFFMQTAPVSPDSLLQGMETLPEVFLKMARLGWEGYFRLQQQWLEQIDKVGERAEAARSDIFGQDTLKAWTEIYGQNFRQLLNVPQLGLTRVYQEKLTQAAGTYSRFQEAMADFLQVLSLPVETSMEVMKARLEELGREGNLSDDFKDYYDMWIKILEGHYMTLLKSPGYLDSLGNILIAAGNFKVARQELLGDILKSLQIPTYKDLDELGKEVYQLKKKVFARSGKKAGKPND